MTQPRRKPWPEILPVFLLLIIVILTALRPGDAPWVNDEPIMMEMAIRYNHTPSNLYGFSLPFTPCPYGLQAIRGLRYGPPAVWLDQIFLFFTNDATLMVAGRAILFSLATALALYWFARTLKLNRWYAAVTMLSPWLWFFSRSLWDSTWCIPLSAAMLAAYADTLANSRRAAFALCAACGLLLLALHLMSIPIVIAIAIHILIFRRELLWRWKWDVIVILAVWIYLFWPYLDYLRGHTELTPPPEAPGWNGWLFPLLGGHFLTLGVAGTVPADGWQDFAPPHLLITFATLRWFTRIALLFVWTGMILALRPAWRAVRRQGAATLVENLSAIAILVLIFQTILDGIEHVYFSPHYYSGTWIVYIFFAWLGVDFLVKRRHALRLVLPLTVIYAACNLLGTLIIAISVARNAGTRGLYYGTSLANQIEAVRQIQKHPDRGQIDVQFPNWRLYPWAMKVLLELNPPPAGPRPPAHLVVKYRGAYPGDARIEVDAQSLPE